jgi:hypothetical protein
MIPRPRQVLLLTCACLRTSYVLEQHLHRDEVIRPGAKKLGLFKAIEPVYARSSVVELKSTESYWRVGRVIKDAEIPMKWVKSRTVTINRKRAEAVAQMDGEEPTQQALYAIDQTAIYVPPPVKDVSVPLWWVVSRSTSLTYLFSTRRARFLATRLATSTSTCHRCFPRGLFTFRASQDQSLRLASCAHSLRSRPGKQAAKCAKTLGIDYAEAIVS